jgi:lysozyme
MNDMRVISEEGKALIKKFEGCPQKDGVCHAYKDAVGIWTCGYGFIKDVDEHTTMTVEEAEARLDHELQEYEGYVNSLIEVPLEQHQFDSLVSFTYNFLAQL